MDCIAEMDWAQHICGYKESEAIPKNYWSDAALRIYVEPW